MPNDTQLPLFLDMFLLHQRAARHTARTIEQYRWTLTRFCDWLAEDGVTHPSEITATQIRTFLIIYETKGSSGAYAHAFARAIKTWLNFLVNEEVIADTPMRKVAMPKLDQTIQPPFSESDIRKLLAATASNRFSPARDRAMILTLLDTGLRAAEFVSIQLENIEEDGVIKIMGKGRKERYVALSTATRKQILKWLADRGNAPGPLWLNVEGTPLTKNGVYLAMKRLGKRAGVSPVGLHRFRRTFAITSLRNGIDVHRLRMMLGHSDLTMAKRYLQFAREDIMQAARQTSPVDGWRL